ncbi:MAG: hypothetical protein QM758_21925 [Armatimonas sp.]
MALSRWGIVALGGVFLSLITSIPANAQILNAVDQGWFTVGSHSSSNNNYFTGQSGAEYRSWFVFDLTGVNSMITSASLNLFNPSVATSGGNGYFSPDASETYQVTSTSTAVGMFGPSYSGAPAQAIFDTLGTGTLFGMVNISSADNGSVVGLNFNAAGLAYLNANLGQQVAFGGRLNSLSGGADQFVFGFTGDAGSAGNSQVTLNLTQGPANLTPEVPAGVQAVPILLAVGGMALYQRKKKRA